MHINIDDNLKKRFKAACVLAERKMGDVVAELIEQWLTEQEQQGQSRSKSAKPPST